MLVDLTQDQINKIQIDEGVVVLNFEEETEKILGPTRGGAEFVATPAIRDIEYDGRRGNTAGMQVKSEEDVSLKINTLCCSQENLALAIPNATPKSDNNNIIEQGDFGVIKTENYIKNIAVVTKMLDDTFKILVVKNAMHEGRFNFKAVPKSENEHNLEFFGHYNALKSDEKMWYVKESATNPLVA